MANRPPKTKITRDLLPSYGYEPPALLYGWPFKRDYFVKYAQRHWLSVDEITEKYRERLGCPTNSFNFGDLTEEQARDPDLMRGLCLGARIISVQHLIGMTGLMLEVGRPFSLELERILYIWTNYNIEKVYDKLAYNGRFERIRKILDDAMNECLPDGERIELQWWWSFDDNEVASIIRSNHGSFPELTRQLRMS